MCDYSNIIEIKFIHDSNESSEISVYKIYQVFHSMAVMLTAHLDDMIKVYLI